MQPSHDSRTDTLTELISCALVDCYGTAQPSEGVWERIAGRVGRRQGRAKSRAPYQGLQACDSMLGLQPHPGLPRVPPRRR